MNTEIQEASQLLTDLENRRECVASALNNATEAMSTSALAAATGDAAAKREYSRLAQAKSKAAEDLALVEQALTGARAQLVLAEQQRDDADAAERHVRAQGIAA